MAASQIAARWLDVHEDVVTYLEMKWMPDLMTTMARVKEYILDFGMEKVILR